MRGRKTVEECRVLPITELVGLLRRPASGVHVPLRWRDGFEVRVSIPVQAIPGTGMRTLEKDVVRLSYDHIEDLVKITSIPSPLGRGERFYFLCPGRNCRRRVGKLYLPPGAQRFACRVCHDLTYRSVKEHDKRVDALVRNPEELRRTFEHQNPRKSYLGLVAILRVLEKEKKSSRKARRAKPSRRGL